jgi:hypothetical protein
LKDEGGRIKDKPLASTYLITVEKENLTWTEISSNAPSNLPEESSNSI